MHLSRLQDQLYVDGSGDLVLAIDLTLPDGTEIEIATEATPPYNSSSRFDLTSTILLTLGKAPR